MNWIKRKFWQWPDGLVWKITEKPTLRSRKKKYNLFFSLIKPTSQETILDVGVSPFIGRITNFLELWYPYPENITALTIDNPEKFENFRKRFPKVKLVIGDGRNIPFPDSHFDIAFSNAVVEHVGGVWQKQFIHEVVRVSRKAIITTPNYWFPVDAHSLIPFAHWFPQKMKLWIYKKFGREYWADKNHLNLLSAKRFLSLFPDGIKVKLIKQKIFGITSVLIAIVEKN